MTRTHAPALLLTLTFALVSAACGNPATETSTANQRAANPNSNDATRRPAAETTPDDTANGGTVDDTASDDCAGVQRHEGQDTCDDDDRKVANGTDLDPDQTDNAKKPDDTKKPDEPAKPAPTPAPTATPAPTPGGDPNVVIFRIKAGTGTSSWNTAAEMVNVKVGQTLRLVNDDTVTHRLHTNGAPCPHGSNFAPGASFDCKVTKEFDSAKTPAGMYDHIAGNTAVFNVKASK
jgi:hypothetical protein